MRHPLFHGQKSGSRPDEKPSYQLNHGNKGRRREAAFPTSDARAGEVMTDVSRGLYGPGCHTVV